ncbi:MAG: lipocalin family protein [Chitinophagaceae bacterium]|nr:lipocalin family protein [Chitinophagaceae bacterium]
MKNHYLKGIILAAVITLTVFACKRKDDDLEVALTAKSLAGQYKLTALTGETSFTPPSDAMGQLEPCELDNIYELKADSTASSIDAGVVCSPAKNYSFEYDITTNRVSLVGLQNEYFTGGTVKVFDGKKLVLETKINSPETFNQDVTIVATLTRQ